MKKYLRGILVLLTLAMVVSLAACKPGSDNKPGAATGSIDDNTPTEEPVPADPIIGEWQRVPDDEDDDEAMELVFEKSGEGFSKAGGDLYAFEWTRTEDTMTVTDVEGDYEIRILELTDDKLVLLPVEEGEYGEDDKLTLERKAPRDPGDMSKDKLIGKWDQHTDAQNCSFQFNADGYGEAIDDWNGLCFFRWTLTGDELRIFIEGSIGEAYYYYVSVSGDKLTMDNEFDEPGELTRNANGARVSANVNKDDLAGKWDSSIASLQFNADGTGTVSGSDCSWSVHGDVLIIVIDPGLYSSVLFFVVEEVNGTSLALSDKIDEPFYFTRIE